MSRILYLHIGSHKTGTTSIQNALAANTNQLNAQGFGYVVGQNGINLNWVFGQALFSGKRRPHR